LELLPWTPEYAWGYGWAATTNFPTPMGTIFIDTDLNHLGYVLDRDSVPLCQNVSRADKEQEKNCLIGEGDRFTWTNRDFIVDKTIITQFILMFLLNNNARCDDMRRRAAENDFVLYNSFFTQGNEFHTEHHYSKKKKKKKKS
jgi:predicted solute-binding protein